MSCRNPVRPYKLIETNRYGFAAATLDERDEGQGFRCAYVTCWECRRRFIPVWPCGRKTVPCVFCENQNVWVR